MAGKQARNLKAAATAVQLGKGTTTNDHSAKSSSEWNYDIY